MYRYNGWQIVKKFVNDQVLIAGEMKKLMDTQIIGDFV